MWAKVKTLLAQSKVLVGIEVVQDGNDWVYHVAILERKGSKVGLHSYKLGLLSEEDVVEFIPDDVPVYIMFNIKGILHRQTTKTYESLDKYLENAFPNAKKEDFYGQVTKQKTNTWVSIARKSLFDGVLQRSSDKKYFGDNVMGLFLGNIHCVLAQNLVESPLDELKTSNTQLVFFEKELHSHKITPYELLLNPQELRIGGESVPQCIVPAFLAPLSALYGENLGVQAPIIDTKREDYVYKKAFQLLGMAVLGFFFIALLVNYFMFSSYQESNASLETELFAQEILVQQRDTLKAQYMRKSEVFGSGEQSSLSFYADRLASSLPSSIELVELAIYPQVKTSYYDEREQPNYQTGKIVVEGQCFGIVYYNNWKRALKELDWVESLHHISYQDIDEDTGAFTLEITVADVI